MMKLNSSLTLQYQRVFRLTAGFRNGNPSSFQLPKMYMAFDSYMRCCICYYSSAGYQRNLILQLPLDGSKTGTYSVTAPYGGSDNVTIIYGTASIPTSTTTMYFNSFSTSFTQNTQYSTLLSYTPSVAAIAGQINSNTI
jgi:hypothetical protein